MKKLVLIDGSGYIFRAYHALPPLKSPQGVPVGAVYGFCTMLKNLIDLYQHDYFVVVFDAKRHTFRQEIYADYKAHRPPPPDDLIPQFDLIRQACTAFGVPFVAQEGFEADDLIAAYAHYAVTGNHAEVVVISCDKDLMQLMTDQVQLYDPMKGKHLTYEDVIAKFGVLPDRVVDVQALAGDSSDNVPGVPGIGVKTAAELIGQFGTLEGVLENAPLIKQPKRRQSLIDHADNARISKQLVTLVTTAPLPLPLDQLNVNPDIFEETVTFLQNLGFKTLVNRLTAAKGQEDLAPHPKETTSESTPAALPAVCPLETPEAVEIFLQNALKSERIAFDFDDRDGKTVLAIVYEQGGSLHAGLIDDSADHPEILSHLWAEKGILKIGHDIKRLYHHDFFKQLPLHSYDDVYLMYYCLYGSLHDHKIDTLAALYVNTPTLPFLVDRATALWHLFDKGKSALFAQKLATVYYDIERPLVPVIAAMEIAGVQVDMSALGALKIELTQRLKTVEGIIYGLCNHTFNIASPKQLGLVLFDEQKLPKPKLTKSGAYATDSDVLEQLAHQGYDVAQHVLVWRGLWKLLTTYVEGLSQEINPLTGRIHTSYNQGGTTTGRLSSAHPNLQNIPIKTEDGRRIRKAFIAPKGYKLVCFDYSQIELRLLAYLADIPVLKEAFHHNKDIHTQTASLLFEVPYDQVSASQRRQAKTVNFGILYGISAFGLAAQLQIPRDEASTLIKAYKARYPEIDIFMEKQKEVARQQGYVKTLYHRRCYTKGILDKKLKSFAERQAGNAPLQGSNADIIKKAMIAIHQWLNEHPGQGRLLLQVHDELVFEVKDDCVDRFIPPIKHIMETITSIPLVVDVAVDDTWAHL